MDPIGRANDNKDLLLSKKEMQYMLDFIKQKRKEKGHMYVKYGCSGFLGLDYEKEVKHQYSCCLTGINIGSILYNGDIFVCPNVPRNEKTIQGNVRNNRFKDIWDNKFEIYRNKETRNYSFNTTSNYNNSLTKRTCLISSKICLTIKMLYFLPHTSKIILILI